MVHIIYERRQCIVTRNKFKLSGFYFREIKNIIYKWQKCLACRLDIAGIFKNFVIIAFTKYHGIHSENGIYRSSNLMRHICKKDTFCIGGGYRISFSLLCFFICNHEFLIFLFNHLYFHFHMACIFGYTCTVAAYNL